MKRKIYNALKNWKENKQNECLLINGARQVGKTYIVEEFGKNNYSSFIEINFMQHPEMSKIFDDSLDVNDICMKMSAFIPGIKLIPGKTLIFLDEIQECANARTAEKFFAIDGRFDVIASGSLLGLELNNADRFGNTAVIPVGYETCFTMYSMDYEEFLWALGYDSSLLDYTKKCFNEKREVPDSINQKLLELLRQYMVVGGMPDVVKTFVKTKNYSKVQESQDKIISEYKQDIVKHAPVNEKINIKDAYESIPRQLAKENKKFQYSKIADKKATASKYKYSVDWLKSANLVHLCNNVSQSQFPLVAYSREDQFKIYLNDTGLLVAMYGFDMKKAILTKSLQGDAKGGIYENLISEILVKNGYKLHYLKKDDNRQEIEFLITHNGEIVPIEVKASNNRSISLNEYIMQYKPSEAYKVIDGNVGCNSGKLSIPHYMAVFL